MIELVQVPAKKCTCDICGHVWTTLAKDPEACANQNCHSREWNGKKVRRSKTLKIELPKPTKVRLLE